jgi:hypothetical protein
MDIECRPSRGTPSRRPAERLRHVSLAGERQGPDTPDRARRNRADGRLKHTLVRACDPRDHGAAPLPGSGIRRRSTLCRRYARPSRGRRGEQRTRALDARDEAPVQRRTRREGRPTRHRHRRRGGSGLRHRERQRDLAQPGRERSAVDPAPCGHGAGLRPHPGRQHLRDRRRHRRPAVASQLSGARTHLARKQQPGRNVGRHSGRTVGRQARQPRSESTGPPSGRWP